MIGDPRDVRAGDVALCTTPGEWFSAAIRRVTGSQASHAALVVQPEKVAGNFLILEVGVTIRFARIQDFPTREYAVFRPSFLGRPIDLRRGTMLALDGWRWLEDMGLLHALYPFWMLPWYLARRDWRARHMLRGPRQVCSAITARILYMGGVDLWKWDAQDNRQRITTLGDIDAIDPGELLHDAYEEGWSDVCRTDHAPVW